MNNPYTPQNVIQDARMFFGRTHEVSEIRAFLNGNQSVSIVGPQKIGKTSLLFHLAQTEAEEALGSGGKNRFVYIDCRELSDSPKEEIFSQFSTEITKAFQPLDLEQETALQAAVTKPSRTAFEFALRKLSQGGLRIVLMLDDFELLTRNPHVDLSFYNALRSAAGRLLLTFLTASTKPLIELTCFDNSQKILSSPFFNIFAQLFLGPLSESEARDMIRTPMEAAGIFANSQLEELIYQLAGGHPHALQIACFNAWDNPGDLPQIEQLTLRDLEPYFQNCWNNLSPAERDVLRRPAEAGLYEAGNAAIAIALRDLRRKCLLVQEGVSYKYPSKAWTKFISKLA